MDINGHKYVTCEISEVKILETASHFVAFI